MSTPNRAVTQRSTFGPEKTITLDPWSVNPLLDDAEQAQPALAAVARKSNGEPPTLFESGDLPPFTASGVDPQHLTRLPFRTRHTATPPQPSRPPPRCCAWWKPTAPTPTRKPRHPAWTSTATACPVGCAAPGPTRTHRPLTRPHRSGVNQTLGRPEGDLYDSMFGASDAATAAKRAPMNAAAADFAAQRAKTGKYSGIGKAQR